MSNEADKSNALTKEVRKFGETVSIRGIPKIFKTKDVILKLVWLISVLLSTAILCWQLSLLFIKYVDYPVATTFGEDEKGSSVFPDISICSLYPLALAEKANISFEKYFNRTKVDENDWALWKWLDESNETDTYLHDYVFYILQTPNMYFSNFPKNGEPPKKCPKFIVDCQIFDKTLSYTNINCSLQTRKFWHVSYYSCYTISLKSSIAESTRGISLAIYLESDFQDILVYKPRLFPSSPRGVRVSVHNRGTKPDFRRAITAGVGSDTVIKITPTTRHRLSRPYNAYDCTDRKYLPYSIKDTYTYDACQAVCYQQVIIKNCYCLYYGYKFTTEQLNENIVCGNRSCVQHGDDVSCNQVGIDDLACALRATVENNFDHCEEICKRPCKEIIYDLSIVVSPWPHPAYELDIYDNYLNSCITVDDRIKEKFAPYTDASNEFSKTGNKRKAIKALEGNTLIKNSFLQLSFIIEKDKPFKLIDKPVYTWDSMIGLVGGCLSLWLGITVMTGIELVEFFYFIFGLCCRPKTKKNNAVVDMTLVQSRA